MVLAPLGKQTVLTPLNPLGLGATIQRVSTPLGFHHQQPLGQTVSPLPLPPLSPFLQIALASPDAIASSSFELDFWEDWLPTNRSNDDSSPETHEQSDFSSTQTETPPPGMLSPIQREPLGNLPPLAQESDFLQADEPSKQPSEQINEQVSEPSDTLSRNLNEHPEKNFSGELNDESDYELNDDFSNSQNEQATQPFVAPNDEIQPEIAPPAPESILQRYTEESLADETESETIDLTHPSNDAITPESPHIQAAEATPTIALPSAAEVDPHPASTSEPVTEPSAHLSTPSDVAYLPNTTEFTELDEPHAPIDPPAIQASTPTTSDLPQPIDSAIAESIPLPETDAAIAPDIHEPHPVETSAETLPNIDLDAQPSITRKSSIEEPSSDRPISDINPEALDSVSTPDSITPLPSIQPQVEPTLHFDSDHQSSVESPSQELELHELPVQENLEIRKSLEANTPVPETTDLPESETKQPLESIERSTSNPYLQLAPESIESPSTSELEDTSLTFDPQPTDTLATPSDIQSSENSVHQASVAPDESVQSEPTIAPAPINTDEVSSFPEQRSTLEPNIQTAVEPIAEVQPQRITPDTPTSTDSAESTHESNPYPTHALVTSEPVSQPSVPDDLTTSPPEEPAPIQLKPLGAPEPLAQLSNFLIPDVSEAAIAQRFPNESIDPSEIEADHPHPEIDIEESPEPRIATQKESNLELHSNFPDHWENLEELLSNSTPQQPVQPSEDAAWNPTSSSQILSDTTQPPDTTIQRSPSEPPPPSETVSQTPTEWENLAELMGAAPHTPSVTEAIAPVAESETPMMMAIESPPVTLESPILQTAPQPESAQAQPQGKGEKITPEEFEKLAQTVYQLLQPQWEIERERRWNYSIGPPRWVSHTIVASPSKSGTAKGKQATQDRPEFSDASSQLISLVQEISLRLQQRLIMEQERFGINHPRQF